MKKWASTAVAVSLALATSLASSSATLVQFKQTLMASDRNRIQFNEYEVKPDANFLLGTSDTVDPPDNEKDLILCTNTNKTVNSGTATIMIAISKCVNKTSIDLINAWVDSIKTTRTTYLDADGNTKNLTFATTLVPGGCEARSEKTKRGLNDTSGYSSQTLLSDGTDYTQFTEVLPQEVERIQAFARFGRVLPALPEVVASDATQVPVAVVSFVNNELSYDYVEQWESKYKITNKFNFQFCKEGEACGGKFENCILLDEDIDLFMYNPFQVVRSTECTGLVGGVPVTYLDAKSEHQCYCKCPAGYEMIVKETGSTPECVKKDPETCDCVWQKTTPSLHIDNTKKLDQCLFTNLSSCWHLDVPFPVDNYVADYRTNRDDGTTNLATGPRIDLVVTRIGGDLFKGKDLKKLYEATHADEKLSIDDIAETTTKDLMKYITNDDLSKSLTPLDNQPGSPVSAVYEWKVYQQNRNAKIDSIQFGTYGKFNLSLTATDYSDSATCLGCVEIVDKFRPKNTTQCPLRVCDNSTSLCSSSKAGVVEIANTPEYNKLQSLVDAVYTFRDSATNDKCGGDRCDKQKHDVKDWFATDYTAAANFDDGKTCLSQSTLESSFIASQAAKENPLTDHCDQDEPVPAFNCKRCCKYGLQLREWWVDYKCANEYDIKRCDGDAPPCDFEQCVALNGDSLATATAKIQDTVKAESDKVLASLGVEGFQTYTQVHRALPCTDFDETNSDCSYSASVTDLFVTDASLKFITGTGPASDYVFWRYKIADETTWHLWSSATAHTFNKPATRITIEAWTACGRVRKFYFYVHLHTHSDIKVCDYFKGMWYQTTVSHAAKPEDAELCAYPGSDFAELTFDYQANIGLKYAFDRLRMNVTNVKCDLAFTDKKSAQILDVTGASMDIIERYAVELQNLEKTSPRTQFTVNCTFTYAQYGGNTKTHSCDRAFTIKDCDAPTIDTPNAKCSWDDCAGQGKPGPYEVCSGNVVASTASATYLNTTEAECCQGCENTKTTCTSILDLPVGRDIKRCVPESGGVYGGDDYYDDSTYEVKDVSIGNTLGLLAKAAANHPTAAAATVLLAASALVALVALVVVRQRRAETMIVEDAYYPLLH